MYRQIFVTLAAFRLVLFAGVETCMQPYWESDANITVWSGVYKLTPGDSICIQNETIEFVEKSWNGPLTKLYDTAAWNYTMDHQWSCSGGSCNRLDCMNARDGVPSEEDQKLDRKAPVNVISRKYCGINYGASCPLSTFCTWVNVNISVRSGNDDIAVVHRVQQLTLRSKFVGKLSGCSYTVGTHRTPVVSGRTVLTNNFNRSMVCMVSGNKGYPVLGQLGDLQMMESGSFKFDWASIKVQTGYYTAPMVSMPESFMQTGLDVACRKLPVEIDGFQYMDVSDDHLTIVDHEPVDVQVTCDKPPSMFHENEQCTGVIVEKHGIRQSGYGVLLVAQASSKPNKGSLRLRSTCPNQDDIIFQCDDKVHVFELDDENWCFDKIDGILDKTVASIRAGYVIEQHTLAQDWSSSWGLNSSTSNFCVRFLCGNIVFIVLAIIGFRLIWGCTKR